MSLISRLGVVLGLDSADFNAGLGKAKSGLNDFAGGMGASKMALGALGAAFVAGATQAIQFADSINDIAKANEMSVGTVLKLTEAFSTNGGNAEKAAKMFSTFTEKIDEAAQGSDKVREKFAKVGVSLTDLANLSEEELFGKVLAGLKQMPDTISRNALAFDLLGKSVKGADIKGFAEEYLNNKKDYSDMDKSFNDIGNALDDLDRLSRQIKTDFAANIGGAFKEATSLAIKFYESMKSGNEKIRNDFDHLFDHLDPNKKLGRINQPIAKQAEKITSENSSLNTEVAARKLEESAKEQAARKLSEDLKNYVLQLKLQTKEIGQQKSEYEKLKLLFEEGGKYHDLANTKLAQQALNQAKIIDQKQKEWELSKEIYEVQKADAIEQAKKIKAGEDALASIIERREAEKEQFERRVEDLQILKERLDYEAQLVNLSDTQKQKALEYFDLRQKMIRMTKDEMGLSSKELEAYQAKEQAVINSTESTKRAQNTFQAGWNNAWENFAEKAKDSASIGAEAFNSMASAMENALDNFVRTGKLNFKSFAASVIQDLLRIQMKAQLSGIFSSLFGGSDVTGGMGNIFTTSSTNFGNGGGILGALGFANGGSPPVGVPSIVGERGPELFVPKTAGTIIPNNSLSSALGSQPQTVINGNYIANVSAIDSKSFEDRVYQSSNAIWAANQYATKSLAVGRGRT